VIEACTECISRFAESHVYASIDLNVYVIIYIEIPLGKEEFSRPAGMKSGPQGHGLEVIEKAPKTPSARLGFAPVDRTQIGRHPYGHRVGIEK
jgi:hypothetical protein